MSSSVRVPCGKCTACCRVSDVFLRLDKGDNPQFYKTRTAFDPVSKQMGLLIQHKPDGSCVYLGEQGCTIHQMAPFACRMFDCREAYRRLTRQERRKRMRDGDAILSAAQALIDG